MDTKTQWDFLKNSANAKRLAHAYVFSGTDKEEKYEISIRLSQLLFCKTPKKPCLSCSNCIRVKELRYPDLTIVESEEGIGIEQIRKLSYKMSLSAYDSLIKIVIIKDAHKMQVIAQSALLKLLEEPKGDTLFILLCDHAELLLDTIISRTQEIRFSFKKGEAIKDFSLKLEELKKSSLSERFAFAKEMADSNQVEELVESWLLDFRKELLDNVDSKEYSNKVKRIEKVLRTLRTTNVNERLALEQILIEI